MKRIFLIFGLIVSIAIKAQEISIIPQPVELKLLESKKPFILNKESKLSFTQGYGFEKFANYFNEYLQKHYGFKLKIDNFENKRKLKKNISEIFIGKYPSKEHNTIPNKYFLRINKGYILLGGGDDESSFFYAIQTLIQLLPDPSATLQNQKNKLEIPQLEIWDYPRFQYRGMHLDVCRHFFPVSFVKRYIDYLAYHKLNVFHWHLTEDQGWRIEIKKYPELTTIGSKRNGTIIGRYPGTGNDNKRYGGFYTQEEIKEVVQYAKERYIDVIPEIEMPGHSSAAIAAYPWLSCFPEKPTEIPKNMISKKSIEEQKNGRIKLVQETWGVFDDIFCAGKDSTFLFLQNVIDEVIPLFPSKYFHIGGDEAPKTHWKTCSQCQKRIKDLNLKDEHELQSWFVQRIEKYLNSKGKTLIGWDEILEGGLAPNAVVMSWRGEQGGIDAAKQNHDVIMTPGNPVYFDHTQSQNEDSVTIGGYNPIENVYAYEPIPKELNDEQAKHVLGAQANIWTEYMKNTKKVEYMLFPRIAALSEILWSQKENRDWKDFEKRLMGQFKRYDLWNVNYSKAYFDLKATVLPIKDYTGVIWKLTKQGNSGQIKVQENGPSFKFISEKSYETTIRNNGKYEATLVEIISEISNKETGRRRTIYKPISSLITQTFHFNKATGKKITLAKEASDKYPGDGAFTLVNGVINEKGFARSREFLGFSGTNCEAVIDLGSSQLISFVVVNALNRTSSWIWRPLTAEVFGSSDGQTWYSLKLTDDFEETNDGTGKGKMTMSFKATYAQFIKVIITNWGEILAGNPGAGNKPWLFVDEIEVN
jgi:hexosaminidase